MFTVGKVLCPIDFSATTDSAVDAGLQIVASHKAELYLLHVIEGPASAGDLAVEPSRAEVARERVRERLAAIASSHGASVQPHLLVSDGEPAEEILRFEELFGVDMIILAPHGRPTLGKIIFGSVADKVTRGSRAHILIVKGRPDEQPSTLLD